MINPECPACGNDREYVEHCTFCNGTGHLSTYPKRVEDLPGAAFYAILQPESVHIPGDERSRTNPGHGYPEHDEQYWSMRVFPSRDAWVAEVQRLEAAVGYARPFKAVRITPAQITTQVNVKVEDDT